MIRELCQMNTLAINTTDQILGVALLENEKVVGEYVTNVRQGHAERLMPAIANLMENVHWTPENIEKIVVAKGPGSYTGVRIGLTTAKSLAWALNIPIIGVSSIYALAYQARFSGHLISPFFDARRNRVYTGLFQWTNGHLKTIKEERNINMDDWLKSLAQLNQQIVFLSPDLTIYKEEILKVIGKQAMFFEGPYNIIQPAHLALASAGKTTDSVHTLVPNYLRLAEAEANWLKEKDAQQ